MLFSVEQAFVGRDEIRAPQKTPAWEAISSPEPVVSWSHGLGSLQIKQSAASMSLPVSGAPNDGFPLIALKTLFRLSRVLLDQ